MRLVTSDLKEAEKFYKKALIMGHEGVMVKNLDAPYQAGSRVGFMYKVKPVMETLDLVVTGATWGEGRRASWLGSYLLSVYDPERGEYLEIGRMATGLTDEQLAELTELFKPLITGQDGKEVTVRPQYVFEVAYEEIQKSPTYSSGYALRFPRLVRVREDKGIDEADSIARAEALMRQSG
jgi:DNA ligase 1